MVIWASSGGWKLDKIAGKRGFTGPMRWKHVDERGRVLGQKRVTNRKSVENSALARAVERVSALNKAATESRFDERGHTGGRGEDLHFHREASWGGGVLCSSDLGEGELPARRTGDRTR